MLLAATLSEATRTKSDPCIPIKYSILQNSSEMWLFKTIWEEIQAPSSPLSRLHSKSLREMARLDVVTGSSSFHLLSDAGGQFWTRFCCDSAASTVKLRENCWFGGWSISPRVQWRTLIPSTTRREGGHRGWARPSRTTLTSELKTKWR